MAPKPIKINKLKIVFTALVIVCVLSSFINLGFISVFFSVIAPILLIINVILVIYGILRKPYIYVATLIVYLLNFNFFYQVTLKKDENTHETISILSYNVKGFDNQTFNEQTNATKLNQIERFISTVDSDILLLQESSYKKSYNIKNYQYIFLGYREQVSKSLLTIYSKFPILDKGYIDFSNTKNNAIYADIVRRKDTIRIYNVHLESFLLKSHMKLNARNLFNDFENVNNKINKQIEQVALIKSHAKNSPYKTIICGDFNATPYSLTYRLMRKGLNDSHLSKGHGLGTTFSIFNYPLRLDYLLYDSQINATNHKAFDLNLSDHEPILAHLQL
jgi:endonuclease/exonuclease/phosphatase family metal-dependent hydrolase